MNDEQTQIVKESNQNLLEIQKGLHSIASALGEQNIILIRLLAAQASNFAVIRSYIVDGDAENELAAGENKKFFLEACKEFEKQLADFQESRDAMKLLNSFDIPEFNKKS